MQEVFGIRLGFRGKLKLGEREPSAISRVEYENGTPFLWRRNLHEISRMAS